MNVSGLGWLRFASGVIVFGIGVLWALQGIGVVGGSVMTRQTQWLLIGLLVAVIGLWLIYRALRPRQGL